MKSFSKLTFIGVDGEGQNFVRSSRHLGDHRYVMLAAATESGKHWHVENDRGLDTETCLDFLLNVVPVTDALLFAYSFGYDLTKILADLPDQKLYLLLRPDERLEKTTRRGKTRWEPRPVEWRGYRINITGSRLTIQRGKRVTTLWDIFKFYQSKFVAALKDWKVGDPELHARMQRMKDQRSEFDLLSRDHVREYCFEECVCMARLARKLVDAHESAGLKLKSFHGAGSSASAMLDAMKIKDQLRVPPAEMHDVLARAFFGGRFENSVIGRIEGPVYNYDISSAYPYQITFLPCLVHGAWERATERKALFSKSVRTAFVRYALDEAPKEARFQSWGPFPYREENGSISFPIESGGGWVGLEEYLAGERLFPHVRFCEAWVYRCDCDCRPFARIPEFYKARIKIGKEGPGIVLKLGYNACYGKLAQSVGSAAYNSWVWASLITSGTRAQILDLLERHKNWSNLLMVATDGVYTREKIQTPMPRDTGTWELPCPIEDKCTCAKCKVDGGKPGVSHKPLGGWEEKIVERGVFVARPGIYFPMNPTEKELKDVRGRGVGKGIVLANWRKIVDHWERYGLKPTAEHPYGVPCVVANVQRFCGAKSSIHRTPSKVREDGSIEFTYGRADGVGQCAARCAHPGCGHVPAYGQWIIRPVEMSFHPMPKRERVAKDGKTLEIRRMNARPPSAPYNKAIVSAEAAELIAAKAELLEQPDADFVDMGIDE